MGGFLPETIIRIPRHIFSPKLMALYFKLLKGCATIHSFALLISALPAIVLSHIETIFKT